MPMLVELSAQADLLHGIPSAIVSPEVTEDDWDFLNRHARYYFSRADPDWANYRTLKQLIHQLFVIVAYQHRSELTWSGPELDDVDRKVLGFDTE